MSIVTEDIYDLKILMKWWRRKWHASWRVLCQKILINMRSTNVNIWFIQWTVIVTPVNCRSEELNCISVQCLVTIEPLAFDVFIDLYYFFCLFLWLPGPVHSFSRCELNAPIWALFASNIMFSILWHLNHALLTCEIRNSTDNSFPFVRCGDMHSPNSTYV